MDSSLIHASYAGAGEDTSALFPLPHLSVRWNCARYTLVIVTLRINLQAINYLCMPRRPSKALKAARRDSKPPCPAGLFFSFFPPRLFFTLVGFQRHGYIAPFA